MAVSNNVKWGKNDEVKLRNIVKRFNAKVTRVSKKHPEIAYLQPPKISVKGIRETLKGISRKEINWNRSRGNKTWKRKKKDCFAVPWTATAFPD